MTHVVSAQIPKRVAFRYHGGKFKLRHWIISHFPEHRVYVEPFAGAASVLLAKPRCYAEVLNDLDGQIVNVFKVMRDNGDELRRVLELTPFARDEFNESALPSSYPLEQARRTIVRAFMGFGSNGIHKDTGFRANSNKSGTTPAHDWANYPACLDAIVSRLQGVVIENRRAIDCMRQHDSNATLHYVDPPYVLSSRTDSNHDYQFEMTDDDHRELLNELRGLRGMVVLSGYQNDIYAEMLPNWTLIEKSAHADGARDRVECLWLSPNIKENQKTLL